MKAKIYLGLRGNQTRTVFRAIEAPTPETTPQYLAVIGPFRTMRGAKFMRDFGQNNPHCQCVADAEQLAKKYTIVR